jgi:hypothetical protein
VCGHACFSYLPAQHDAHLCPVLRTGPSDEARAKSLAKRRSSGGKQLYGRAAKLKRGGELLARGTEQVNIEEELKGVGHAGEPFFVDRDVTTPLGDLPERFSLVVSVGEDACTSLATYHAACCQGAPDLTHGRDHALSIGWAAPQQRLALDGCHKGGPQCNLVVMALDDEGPAGIMSAAYHWDSCVVQVVHAMLRTRGTGRLPEHLWARTAHELGVMPLPQQPQHRGLTKAGSSSRGMRAHARAGSSSTAQPRLRVQLEMGCCQSKQGAAFWMGRCGWDGSEDSRYALNRWQGGDTSYSSKSGHYAMWYDIDIMPAQ